MFEKHADIILPKHADIISPKTTLENQGPSCFPRITIILPKHVPSLGVLDLFSI